MRTPHFRVPRSHCKCGSRVIKTIEQEIRERLAAESLSPENVDAAMAWIKADTMMFPIYPYWDQSSDACGEQFVESVWVSAWSSARDWILQQLTAPIQRVPQVWSTAETETEGK